MPLRFSPVDVDATIWFTASESRVQKFPGTDRVQKWLDRFSGDYPLTGFEHGDDPSDPYSRAPLLSDQLGNGLNGRPTLVFPAGSYLKGATRAWTGNWNYPDPETIWSWDYEPEEEAAWWWNDNESYRYQPVAFPANGNHAFVLARVFPPSLSLDDPIWTEGETGYYDNGTAQFLPRRPVIFSPRVGTTSSFDVPSYPGLRIQTWDPLNSSAPGTLVFYGDASWATRENLYEPDLPGQTMVDRAIPFDRFGQWTLFEWKVQTENVAGVDWVFAYLYLNGRQASRVHCPDQNFWDPYDFHLFGESIGEGAWADVRASQASGNVAEVVFCRRALSDDEAARTRAWMCRRWGLESLLVGQPYASVPEIPGSDPVVPTAFPGVPPSGRTYVPGAYSNTAFGSVGGVERRVRHSRTVYAGDRLSLTYEGLSESKVLEFLAHYASCQGARRTFGLRPETLVNLGAVARHLDRARTRAEYAPRGSSWAYVSEPVVRNRQLNVNQLTVELELLAEPFDLGFPADERRGTEIGSDASLSIPNRAFVVDGEWVIIDSDAELQLGP